MLIKLNIELDKFHHVCSTVHQHLKNEQFAISAPNRIEAKTAPDSFKLLFCFVICKYRFTTSSTILKLHFLWFQPSLILPSNKILELYPDFVLLIRRQSMPSTRWTLPTSLWSRRWRTRPPSSSSSSRPFASWKVFRRIGSRIRKIKRNSSMTIGHQVSTQWN